MLRVSKINNRKGSSRKLKQFLEWNLDIYIIHFSPFTVVLNVRNKTCVGHGMSRYRLCGTCPTPTKIGFRMSYVLFTEPKKTH